MNNFAIRFGNPKSGGGGATSPLGFKRRSKKFGCMKVYNRKNDIETFVQAVNKGEQVGSLSRQHV